MANSATHAALPYPIKNARYTVQVPFLDADGDPVDATSLDTEISGDNGAFADAAEEVTLASGARGMGIITLTGAETNYSTVHVWFGCATAKATLLTLTPAVLAIVSSGTLSAGSAGGGTLGTVLAYDVTGCFIRTTGGTGGGGTGGAANQARKIITYTIATGAFTVAPNWETAPDTDTTYDVLLPEGVTLGALKALNPTTAGRTLDVSAGGEAGIDWANVGSPTTTVGLSGTTISTSQVVASVAGAVGSVTGAVGSVTGAVGSVTGAVGSVTGNVGGNVAGSVASVTGAVGSVTGAVGSVASGGITAASFGAGAITAGVIADGAIDTATFASGTTIPRVTLADTVTTYTGNTPQTGDSYAVVSSGTHGNAALKTLIDTVDTVVDSILDDTGTAGVVVASGSKSGYTISGTTTTLDALQTALNSAHGAGSWATATGFSTHSAADVWAVATRVLTAGTNIVLAKGTGVTGFTDITAAAVNAEVVDALATDTYAEPGQGAPGATVSLSAKLGHLYKASRNKSDQTAILYRLYADDASTVDAKATCSDDGTFVRGEIVTGP